MPASENDLRVSIDVEGLVPSRGRGLIAPRGCPHAAGLDFLWTGCEGCVGWA